MIELAERCPACLRDEVPTWRRWLGTRRFQCRACAAWLVLHRPKPARLAKHPNFTLFVLMPFGMVGLGVTLGAARIFLARQPAAFTFAFIGCVIAVVIGMDVRGRSRARYVQCADQERAGSFKALAKAWERPEFRRWVLKVTLATIEILALSAAAVLLIKHIRSGF